MDTKFPSNSDILDSVRKMAISRRGGVRTRGGRLPPINLREITQVTVKKENKKVIAPNIPQRRRTVKQELEIKEEVRGQPKTRADFRDSRGRGRGRQPKVYIQTEGAFLAEGPAEKTKKDPLASESLSYCRALKAAVSDTCNVKYDSETLKKLLESYDEYGAFEDDYGTKPPYRLPLLKKKSNLKIKTEAEKNGIKMEKIKIKKEIKSESDEDGEEEKVIKTEKEENDSDDDFIGRRKIKIKREILSESEDSSSSESEIDGKAKKVPHVEDEKDDSDDVKFADIVQKLEDKGKMILLQIPVSASVPGMDSSEENSKERKIEIEEKPEEISTFIDQLEEGCVGKLQIMKSGRVKMKLGSVEFELIDGTSSESSCEAVSIQVRDDTGDLAVLGKLEKKLILSPTLDMLLMKNNQLSDTRSGFDQ